MSVADKTVDSLRFPALVLSATGDLFVVHNKSEVEATNTLALRRGYYSNLLIIEASGQRYRAVAVTNQRPIGPFWGIRFLKPRRIRVKLQLVPESQLTLSEVQKLVIETLNANAHPWEGGAVDVAELEATVRRARSIDELIRALN